MIIVRGCCYSNFSVKFLLWIVYVPGYSVDYFHQNTERIISVIMHFLIQLLQRNRLDCCAMMVLLPSKEVSLRISQLGVSSFGTAVSAVGFHV